MTFEAFDALRPPQRGVDQILDLENDRRVARQILALLGRGLVSRAIGVDGNETPANKDAAGFAPAT